MGEIRQLPTPMTEIQLFVNEVHPDIVMQVPPNTTANEPFDKTPTYERDQGKYGYEPSRRSCLIFQDLPISLFGSTPTPNDNRGHRIAALPYPKSWCAANAKECGGLGHSIGSREVSPGEEPYGVAIGVAYLPEQHMWNTALAPERNECREK